MIMTHIELEVAINMNNPNQTASTRDLESGLIFQRSKNPRLSTKAKWLKALAKAAIPATVILLFLSRPLIAMTARNTCYYLQDNVSFWSNPFFWAIHSTSSVYKCEWMGHWGFNWLGTLSWIGDKGASALASLSVLGGSYAAWKNISTWLGKKDMTAEDKEKLRILSQFISTTKLNQGLERDLDQSLDSQISFSDALRFSDERDAKESSAFSPSQIDQHYRYSRSVN